MSGLKRVGIASAVVVALGAVLVASGAVRLRGPEEADASAPEGTPAETRQKREPEENLDALGYISAVPIKPGEEDRKGVVTGAEGAEGLFVVNPTWEKRAQGPVREAFLWSMAGKQLHRWVPQQPDAGEKGWGGARLDDEGFLHVVSDTALVKYDWDGNEVWRHEGRHHHDLNFDLDGSPIVVSEQIRTVPGVEGVAEMVIKDHGLVFFSRDGEVEQELWLYDVFKDHPRLKQELVHTVRWKSKRFGERVDWTRPSDIFHLNSLEVLPRDIEGLGQRGDILVSPRHFDLIAVIDRESRAIEWTWGEGELDHQHDPTLTHADQVVVFDNGKKRRYSRVLVIEPSGAIARDFRGEKPFYSSGRGSVQSLADGSLFVVISNEARIVQVGPDSDAITWEFVSPWVVGGARLPLRAAALEGPVLQRVQSIVDGTTPPPQRP